MNIIQTSYFKIVSLLYSVLIHRNKPRTLILSVFVGYFCLITTPVQAHIKCPFKFLGTTNDKCPHGHYTSNESESGLGGNSGPLPSAPQQQRNTEQQWKAQEAYRVRREKEKQRYEQALRDQKREEERGKYNLIQKTGNNLRGKWISTDRKRSWQLATDDKSGRVFGRSLDTNTRFMCHLKIVGNNDVICEGRYTVNSKEKGVVKLRSELGGYSIDGSTTSFSSGRKDLFSWGRQHD